MRPSTRNAPHALANQSAPEGLPAAARGSEVAAVLRARAAGSARSCHPIATACQALPARLRNHVRGPCTVARRAALCPNGAAARVCPTTTARSPWARPPLMATNEDDRGGVVVGVAGRTMDSTPRQQAAQPRTSPPLPRPHLPPSHRGSLSLPAGLACTCHCWSHT